jgi:LAO/AO transport system kinase
MWQQLLAEAKNNQIKSLARLISLIENRHAGYIDFLQSLQQGTTGVIGITGPPGAGKSTLTDGLIEAVIAQNKKVAVLCVDPSSPFNLGALLGDRIRMADWYNNPNVFIRSLATRGSLGGLHPQIIEITDVLKVVGFDLIIVETVGVGQSEIEIAGLADVTVVVVVPEAGDEVQTMKAGLMEIADLFVVNKADRPDAEVFVKNLRQMLAPAFRRNKHEIAVIKTIANQKEGLTALYTEIEKCLQHTQTNDKKFWLLTEKAWQLIQHKRMADIKKADLKLLLEKELSLTNNIYKIIQQF